MNNKYFTKYLPVGTIQDTPGDPTVKLKLFLCSRDTGLPIGEVITEGIKEDQEFSSEQIKISVVDK